MTDLIAKIMIALGPVIVLIGAIIFLYIHREQWRQEMKELTDTADTWSPSEPPVTTLWDELNLPTADDEIRALIHHGFEPAVVERICQATGLADSLIRQTLNLPSPAALNRRQHRRFTTAESDRIYSLVTVTDAAFSLFEGEREAACQWLKSPCVALDMNSPIENLGTFFGLQQVLGLIHRLEHGVHC